MDHHQPITPHLPLLPLLIQLLFLCVDLSLLKLAYSHMGVELSIFLQLWEDFTNSGLNLNQLISICLWYQEHSAMREAVYVTECNVKGRGVD